MSQVSDTAARRAPAVQATDPAIDRELTEPVALCRPDGTLDPRAIGWSRHPLHTANLCGPPLRHKRWEYWCVTTERHLLTMTYADIGYLGLVECSFLDLAPEGAAPRFRQHVVPVPFARGLRQPDVVGGGSLSFRGAGLTVEMREEAGGTRLLARSRLPLRADLEADVFVALPPAHETLSVVVPWDRRRFQLTSKHQCRPAAGEVRIGARRYRFGPEAPAFGCLDFGRGYWPHRTRWNWGSASGVCEGRTLGLNLGDKWTDGTGTTENALVLDGRLHRVREPVRFRYDPRDFTRPWRLRAPSGAVDLRFEPVFERRARVSLGVLSTEVHQCFGFYEGTVRAGESELRVERLFGWAEEHAARW